MDGVPPGGLAREGTGDLEGDKPGVPAGGGSGVRRRSERRSRDSAAAAAASIDTGFGVSEGLPVGVRGGTAFAKAEQVLGQRMERVATAWLEAIDQVSVCVWLINCS